MKFSSKHEQQGSFTSFELIIYYLMSTCTLRYILESFVGIATDTLIFFNFNPEVTAVWMNAGAWSRSLAKISVRAI